MRTSMKYLVLAISLIAAGIADAGCRSYTNRLSYKGTLATGESKVVAEWTTPCDGAINASAAKGRLTLLALSNGHWTKIREGISTIVPVASAGTYRLIVTNPYGIPSEYAVGLKYGRG
jgi:hypothetical protein